MNIKETLNVNGDIFFDKDQNRWKVNIKYRPENEKDQLAKGHRNRSMVLV